MQAYRTVVRVTTAETQHIVPLQVLVILIHVPTKMDYVPTCVCQVTTTIVNVPALTMCSPVLNTVSSLHNLLCVWSMCLL